MSDIFASQRAQGPLTDAMIQERYPVGSVLVLKSEQQEGIPVVRRNEGESPLKYRKQVESTGYFTMDDAGIVKFTDEGRKFFNELETCKS